MRFLIQPSSWRLRVCSLEVDVAESADRALPHRVKPARALATLFCKQWEPNTTTPTKLHPRLLIIPIISTVTTIAPAHHVVQSAHEHCSAHHFLQPALETAGRRCIHDIGIVFWAMRIRSLQSLILLGR